MTHAQLEKRVRILLILFVVALLLSGLTAFPLRWELRLLDRWFGPDAAMAEIWPGLIDCSFGIFGLLPLWLCRRDILHLEELRATGRSGNVV